MSNAESNPLREPVAMFLVALSMSIGWGIRGNFGHEAGAMIPGMLGAIAIAVTSRRADWQARIPHLALFAGLGWGFGGSISYMYPISFTMSGHFPTMFYGFLATFLEGGLWCAMGTAGAALALSASTERLAALYKPLIVVIAAMFLQHLLNGTIERWLAVEESTRMDDTWHRQESPLYWFDADWMPALFAFFGVCAYEYVGHPLRLKWILPVFTFAWGLGGWFIQRMLDQAGLLDGLVEFLVVPQGDLSYVNPETGQPFAAADLMTNWPQFFGDYPHHVGWLTGALLGFAFYFFMYGKWRSDSGLFVALSLGWLGAFLAMPVFGSIFLADYGGFRMTPPRSDDWAGITGAFAAAMIWCWRRDLNFVTLAGTLSFLLGGVLFAFGHVLRTIARWPGHPHRLPDGTPDFWKHYQDTNWHSVMEQTQGFCLGIAMILALSAVWNHQSPRAGDVKLPHWTTIFAVMFSMFAITHMNVFKNVDQWTKGDRPLVPGSMKAPFLGFIELSAASWFELAWWAAAAACLYALIVHTRRPLALMPASDAGRGQLLYLFVLWVMVIANFERALPGFAGGRIVTEWVVTMNACIATALIATRRTASLDAAIPTLAFPRLRPIWMRGLASAVLLMFAFAALFKLMYGDAPIEHPIYAHKRFGPEAVWRTKPILKHGEHR